GLRKLRDSQLQSVRGTQPAHRRGGRGAAQATAVLQGGQGAEGAGQRGGDQAPLVSQGRRRGVGFRFPLPRGEGSDSLSLAERDPIPSLSRRGSGRGFYPCSTLNPAAPAQ